MTDTVQVNFSKPIALFPLADAILLPHSVLPLHICEPRYVQMVDHCLDSSGQLAMACMESDDCLAPSGNGHALRPVVCVGQIVQHESLPRGGHTILLQGVCRARIVDLIEPRQSRLYRLSRLAPLEAGVDCPPPMLEVRRELRDLLAGPRLRRLRCVDSMMQWFDHDDVSTHVLLELIAFALVRDHEVKYRLLAESDPVCRADIIRCELVNLDALVQRADLLNFRDWPKGQSWN